MKALLFINSLRAGGAERVIAEIADHLVGCGHQVDLVTQLPIESDHYTTSATRLSLQRPNPSANPLDAAINNLMRLGRLIGVLRKQRPDVVLAFMPTAAVVALLAAKVAPVAVIAAERSNPEHADLSPLRRRMQRWLYPQAFAVTVQTTATADWYGKRRQLGNSKPINCQIISNGVKLPLPSSNPVIGVAQTIDANRQVVLGVGRLDSGKNVGALLRAFSKCVHESGSSQGWHLVQIGDGAKNKNLLGLAHQLGIAQRFTLLPQVGNMQDWYERADIFASTSLFEGFPNALLEAMACGCAVVSYACPTGPDEIIEHEVNGLLVPLDDEPAMSEALTRLVNSSDEREALAIAAKNITETHSQQVSLSAWEELLAKAASN